MPLCCLSSPAWSGSQGQSRPSSHSHSHSHSHCHSHAPALVLWRRGCDEARNRRCCHRHPARRDIVLLGSFIPRRSLTVFVGPRERASPFRPPAAFPSCCLDIHASFTTRQTARVHAAPADCPPRHLTDTLLSNRRVPASSGCAVGSVNTNRRICCAIPARHNASATQQAPTLIARDRASSRHGACAVAATHAVPVLVPGRVFLGRRGKQD